LLRAEGKEPVWYVWGSFGINDALAGTDPVQFGDSTALFLNYLRDSLLQQSAPVFMTEISDMGVSGYSDYDKQLDTLSFENSWFYKVETAGLDKQDNNHWSHIGMDSIAHRMGRFMRDTIGLPYGRGTISGSSKITLNTQGVIPVSGESSLEDSPLLYNSTDEAIYQGTDQTGDASYLHKWEKAAASFRMRNLINKIPTLSLINEDDNVEGVILSGTGGVVFGYGSDDVFEFTRYNSGSISSHSFSGAEVVLTAESDASVTIENNALIRGNTSFWGEGSTYPKFSVGRGSLGTNNAFSFSRYNGWLLANNIEHHVSNGSLLYTHTHASLGGAGILYTGTATANGTIPAQSLSFINETASTTAGNQFAGSYQMLLDIDGNFGIGDGLDPVYKLDVDGDVNVSSGSVYRVNGVQLDAGNIPYTNNSQTTTEGALDSLYNLSTPETLRGSAPLDFPSTSAQNSSDLTITVTGAALGDVVSLGASNAAVSANTSYSAWVSADDTVTVRFNNYSSGAVDPAGGTFRVMVFKY
jgi:hypothetical protein